MKRIMYLQCENPAVYPSLEHSSRMLAEQDWKVIFLGMNNSMTPALVMSPHPNISVRLFPVWTVRWVRKTRYIFFCFWVLGQIVRNAPQWVYLSNTISCPLGLLLSYIPTIKIVYHEHDSVDSNEKNIFTKVCLWARRMLAQRIDMCIFPNEQRAMHYRKKTGYAHKIFTIWNCPRLEEVSAVREPYRGGTFWVHYHGTIVPLRFPLTIIDAIAELPAEVHLNIIGYETIGHRGYVNAILNRAHKCGVAERIHINCSTPRKELMIQCQRFHIGLVLNSKNTQELNFQCMVGASVKAFDYLACGMPLVVPDLPDWHTTYVEPGYGLSCDPSDPQSIARKLAWYLEHPDKMGQMGERGRQKVLAEWNYERQFAPVVTLLERY